MPVDSLGPPGYLVPIILSDSGLTHSVYQTILKPHRSFMYVVGHRTDEKKAGIVGFLAG